jgi:hypothetical protein
VAGEQGIGGVEDPVGRSLGPTFGQPVGHYFTVNGTESGRRT